MTPAIEVAALRHVYPDGHRGLDGVDLIVRAGERVAVLGPNGAGKTTLMLHLNGVLRATSGTIRIGETMVTPASCRPCASGIRPLLSYTLIKARRMGFLPIKVCVIRASPFCRSRSHRA